MMLRLRKIQRRVSRASLNAPLTSVMATSRRILLYTEALMTFLAIALVLTGINLTCVAILAARAARPD